MTGISGAEGEQAALETLAEPLGWLPLAGDKIAPGSGEREKLYALLNQTDVRDAVVAGAAQRFGYDLSQVEMHLYAGRFSTGVSETRIRAWAKEQFVGSGPIQVFDAQGVVATVREVAASKQYRDSAVLATLKVLEATGSLQPTGPGA